MGLEPHGGRRDDTVDEELLELAAAVALQSAAIYDLLARRFADEPELSCFWRLHAETARHHAAGVRIYRLGVQAGEVPPGEGRSLLAQLRAWRSELESRPPTLQEAFAVARAMVAQLAELQRSVRRLPPMADVADLFGRDLGQVLQAAEQRFRVD